MIPLSFEPRRLSAIRQQVQQLHPGTADEPPSPASDALHHLRDMILEVASDTTALERLADSLSPREVRAAVGGIERWDDIREACVAIVQRRANVRHLPLLWSAWQRQPLLDSLQKLLIHLGDSFGWNRAVSAPYDAAAKEWVKSPGRGIQIWLARQGLSAADVGELNGCPVQPDSPLARLVRVRVMTHGTLHQLQSDQEFLNEWDKELNSGDALLFGRNYLIKMPPKRWATGILDRIQTRWGTPKKPKIPRFWHPLPDEVKEEFHRRYIQRRIGEELGHDDERRRFWTMWADHIVDLKQGRAGSVRYAELDFEYFVVIEFFKTGNAAYFYLPKDAGELRRGTVSSPADLKRRHRYPLVNFSGNRLIHHPRGGWFDKGNRKVQHWLIKTEGD